MRALRLAAMAALVALAATGCVDDGLAHPDQPYVIASGGTTGVYYAYGQQLAEVLSQRLDADFIAAETAGSVDNLLRIGAGEAVIGFAQSDAAADAAAGVGAFTDSVAIGAVARLYDEYVHVVVRADSPFQRVADLRGYTVSLGARNSGVAVVATRVMDAAGVPLAEVDDRALGLEASIEALQDRRLDGFLWVGGVPTPGLVALNEVLPIRLLTIDPATVDQINARHAGIYRIAELPVGAYEQQAPVSTMTVPNFLVAAQSAPEELVREVLEVLFAARLELAQSVPAAALLDRRQAIFTDPLELHPGAVAYYTASRR